MNTISKYLETQRIAIDKRRSALIEDIKLEDYLQKQDFSIIEDPFPHLVVDNFFNGDTFQNLTGFFKRVLARGLSEKTALTKFSPFVLEKDLVYDGYAYVPWPGENKFYDIFYSMSWNLFFSKLFKIPTGYCTSTAFHYHPIADKTGFVHHDRVEKMFSPSDRIQNGIIFRDTNPNQDENLHVADNKLFFEWRKIAIIFYLGTPNWQETDGGETGLYQNRKKSPIKLIEPLDNRLFAFEISQKSLHAFQTNNEERASIIQWFHVPDWLQSPI